MSGTLSAPTINFKPTEGFTERWIPEGLLVKYMKASNALQDATLAITEYLAEEENKGDNVQYNRAYIR